jgi:serine/threonine-protein kinase RsbW
VSLPTTRGQLPERDTFSWTVLSALAGEVDTGLDDERRVWIRLRKRRSAAGAA